jgi:hypothetical protein
MSFGRRRIPGRQAAMTGDSSILCTAMPFVVQGSAMGPFPMPNSSAGPGPASLARKLDLHGFAGLLRFVGGEH